MGGSNVYSYFSQIKKIQIYILYSVGLFDFYPNISVYSLRNKTTDAKRPENT